MNTEKQPEESVDLPLEEQALAGQEESTEASEEDARAKAAAEEQAERVEEALEVAEAEGAAEKTKAEKTKAEKTKAEKTKKAKPDGDDAGEAVAAETATDEKADKIAEEEENKLPMKWYVIHTYSGHENKVKENIIKMIAGSTIGDHFGRLIVPTEEVAEMKKGKKTILTRKFFPSYILIEMHMSDESWHLVNSIPGVTSFVGTGTKPQPLLPNEVERILGRMDKEKETIIPEIPFTLGEHIRIKDGPFSDFTGVVDEINPEKGKLRVLVSIFGRDTPVELDFLQVESL